MDIREINEEIKRLENGATNYSAVEKLALLYTVRDHLGTPEEEKPVTGYSYKPAPQSEFLEAVNGAPLDDVFAILDEHFEAIRMIYPKEYTVVVKRIIESKGQL